jgi:hypothetical protein
MQHSQRWNATLAGLGLLLGVATSPAQAGRVVSATDPGFELTRIVSQFRGGTSEAIAPWETQPGQPIQGETVLFGQSNVFPESVRIQVSRDGGRTYRTLQPQDFTFTPTVVTPEGRPGSFSTLAIRFGADKVALIQNALVRITIQPMPGGDSTGDLVEAVLLRSPG